MKSYMEQLGAYVHENKITFGQESPQPCLDTLWWHYGEYHNIDSEAAKERFRTLRAQFETLSIEDSDAVCSEIGCLCAEYERIAFAAGLRLGAQLMLELKDPSA